MRLFVAISFPRLGPIEEAVPHLKGMRSVRAVDPGNLHITLKFIGETAIGPDAIAEVLDRAVEGEAPFGMRPSIAGAFPSWRSPSVAWIGFDDDGRSAKLASSVDRELHSSFGIPKEARDFRPHLTLARVKGPTDTGGLRSAAEKVLDGLISSGYEHRVEEVHLIRSQLMREGPIHEKLGTFRLSG